MSLEIVILAAGKGTRMKSDKPKVLHQLAGRPMISHVLDTARKLEPARIAVVCGFGEEQIRSALQADDIVFVRQEEQLGTGHAVMQALPVLDPAATVLVLYGDTPLISEDSLRRLIAAAGSDSLAVLTAVTDRPAGLGRIVRDDRGSFLRIVEEKDATEEEKKIREINTGVCCGPVSLFRDHLGAVGNDNAQKEYYLVDLFAIALNKGIHVATCEVSDEREKLGINDHAQQALLERIVQERQAEALMAQGVTIIDPRRFDLRGSLTCGKDVVIDINVVFEGNVKLGDNVRIGAGCVISNCEIAAGSVISPYSVLESSTMGRENTLGPFCHLRPGCSLADRVHVGNFVEAKKSSLGEGTKAGHLTYIGDSEVGANVNFGAGTITCNYDGANKHRTVIGNDVFIGSDTQLVAPVEIGNGSTLGAGSTITKKVGENELVITRVPQRHIKGWNRPKKASDR